MLQPATFQNLPHEFAFQIVLAVILIVAFGHSLAVGLYFYYYKIGEQSLHGFSGSKFIYSAVHQIISLNDE